MLSRKILSLLFGAALLAACNQHFKDDPSLSSERARQEAPLKLGQHIPNKSEAETVGASVTRVVRGSPAFARLVRDEDHNIVFKDEEGTGADRMMTPRLRDKLRRLSGLVRRHWPGVDLRVTEAWDENGEHGPHSVHYEGRAADMTTSDLDENKLGELARLAVDAGFDWVFYEDHSHVHASVRR